MKIARFQHISPGKAILLLALLVCPAGLSAQESLLSVGFGGILSNYSQIDNPTPSIGFSLNARTPISQNLFLEPIGEYGRFVQKYDTPGGVSSFTIDVWSVDLGIDWRMLRLMETVEFSGEIGIGFTNFHRNESTVSIGALGNLVLPSGSSTAEHLFFGLGISKKITQQLSLEFGTRLRLLSPFAAPETGYSIRGGLNIELF